MSYLNTIAAYAKANLNDRAVESLMSRGVSEEQIELFGVGYIDGKLPELPAEAQDFLRWSCSGEKLPNMYAFPLTNLIGEVNGLQFRSLDKEVKGYRTFYDNKREPALFGLGQAANFLLDTEMVFLVEGVFDLFPVHRAIPWVTATLTARVTQKLARTLKRLVSVIWLGYDRDRAGREASDRVERFYGKVFDVRRFDFPDKTFDGRPIKDLADLWESWGDDRTIEQVRKVVGS